tara:strand:- start:497 stop:775 length:279 start_codon:yes stop_codon:yes gene_type:complete
MKLSDCINPNYKDLTFRTSESNIDAWQLLCDLMAYAELGTVYLVSVNPTYDDDANALTIVINVDVDCLDNIKSWVASQIAIHNGHYIVEETA